MGFIKLPTARKFNYRPRFYDPELEKLREKRAQKHAEEGDGDMSIRAGFARIRKERQPTKVSPSMASNIIKLVTFIFLLAAVYLVFQFTNLFNIFLK